MESPNTSSIVLENPFESDGKLISFLDDIRCGIIQVEPNGDQVWLRFRDYTSHLPLYTANLFQAQTAVRYAIVFGQMVHLKKLKNDLVLAQIAEQIKEPGEYPGLPERIASLSQQIEHLETSLNKVHSLPDLRVYRDTELFTSHDDATDSKNIEKQIQFALTQLADLKKSENKLCRVSLDRFYSFWAQQDLQHKQTYNDANRDFEQIKKKRALFFKALEDGNREQLLAISPYTIIKKASRSTVTFLNKLEAELENYDPNKGSPHNSDEEIW